MIGTIVYLKESDSMEIIYDLPYIYIENPKDEAKILSKFCKNKENKLVFLEIYSEEDILSFFSINSERINILDDTVVYKEQNNKISILCSPSSTIDIRTSLEVFPWDFSAVVLKKNKPIRLDYHIRGYETEDGYGLSIREFSEGSFINQILPLLSNIK
jgi:hypothetical protein